MVRNDFNKIWIFALKITESFSTDSMSTGLGIGLSLVKQILTELVGFGVADDFLEQ